MREWVVVLVSCQLSPCAPLFSPAPSAHVQSRAGQPSLGSGSIVGSQRKRGRVLLGLRAPGWILRWAVLGLGCSSLSHCCLQPRSCSHHTTWQSRDPSSLGQAVPSAGEEHLHEPEEGWVHLKHHHPFLSAVPHVFPHSSLPLPFFWWPVAGFYLFIRSQRLVVQLTKDA